jgi:hypothetical protein
LFIKTPQALTIHAWRAKRKNVTLREIRRGNLRRRITRDKSSALRQGSLNRLHDIAIIWLDTASALDQGF